MESNYNKFVEEYVKLMEQTKKEEEEIKIEKKKKNNKFKEKEKYNYKSKFIYKQFMRIEEEEENRPSLFQQ